MYVYLEVWEALCILSISKINPFCLFPKQISSQIVPKDNMKGKKFSLDSNHYSDGYTLIFIVKILFYRGKLFFREPKKKETQGDPTQWH